MAKSHREQSKEPPKKRGGNRKFDEMTGSFRKAAIELIAKRVIQHLGQRDGAQCAPGFVKGLIDQATETTPNFLITRDDINNAVRRLTKARKQAAAPQSMQHVSPSDHSSSSKSTSILIPEPHTTASIDEASAPLPPASDGSETDDEMFVESTSTEPNLPPPPSEQDCAVDPSSMQPLPPELPSTCNDLSIHAPRNMGGRPRGSTKLAIENEHNNMVVAINWITVQYAEAKDEAESQNEVSEKRVRVAIGTREKIIEEAKIKFHLPDTFTISRKTIESRISRDSLEVWQRGPKSLLLKFEVVLKGLVIQACDLHICLNVSGVIALANSLIHGSMLEQQVIAWKKKVGVYTEDTDTLGIGWWRNFKRRNPDMSSKAAQKFEQHREAHCNYTAFRRMYDNIELALIESGNAVPYSSPVHMDLHGNIVDDESLAFGNPVTLNILRRDNVFCMDETGDNTNGKKDGKKGGEKMVCATSQTPRDLVGTKDAHYTIVPITNLNGVPVMIVVIFPGKTENPNWICGVDVFVPYDQANPHNNHGPGKKHPGLELRRDDGSKVPIYFAYSENASMTGDILKGVFEAMDEEGITTREFDENGKPVVYPLVILDGHGSRTHSGFLTYVNNDSTLWLPILGVPYGTSIWQLHDDKRQNGAFKGALVDAKRKFFRKKREHGLKPEILPTEIVIVAQDAIMNSFMNLGFTLRALSHRGWYPYNRNTLMDPQIISSAPEDVRREMIGLLESRGVSDAGFQVAPATDANMVTRGSGLLAGGASATEAIAETLVDLNHNCPTTRSIVTALDRASKLNAGRINHDERTGPVPSGAPLQKVYNDAKRLTSTVIFGKGNGRLDRDVLLSVHHRISEGEEIVARAARKEKKKLFNTLTAYAELKLEMLKDDFKWNKSRLMIAIRAKIASDETWPKKKNVPELTEFWASMEDRDTPTCSPYNSDDDEDEPEDPDGLEGVADAN